MSARKIVIFLVLQGKGYPLRTQAVSVSCILPPELMKHLARDDNWSTIRGQFDLLMLSVIGTSWRSSRASSKRARGKHPSRSALGPFHPEILPPDWPSPITLANAGFWLVEAGSLGMQRPVWELPEVETSQQHSWLEFLGSDREAELGKAFRCTATRKTFQLHRECRGRTLLFGITSKHSCTLIYYPPKITHQFLSFVLLLKGMLVVMIMKRMLKATTNILFYKLYITWPTWFLPAHDLLVIKKEHHWLLQLLWGRGQ